MKRSIVLRLLLTAAMRSECHVEWFRLSSSDKNASSPANSGYPELGVLPLVSITPQMLNYLVSRLKGVNLCFPRGSERIRRDTINAVSELLAAAKTVSKVVPYLGNSTEDWRGTETEFLPWTAFDILSSSILTCHLSTLVLDDLTGRGEDFLGLLARYRSSLRVLHLIKVSVWLGGRWSRILSWI